MKKITLLLTMATAALLFGNGAFLNAQVTVGADMPADSFAVLELVSNTHNGLRLPQIPTTVARNLISETYGNDPKLMGLEIFNMETKCVETWNGSVWISTCFDVCSVAVPIASVTLTSDRPDGGNVSLGRTFLLTAEITPAAAADYATYNWQKLQDGAWVTVHTSTEPSWSPMINTMGDNYFRVEAFNGCDSYATSTTNVNVTGSFPVTVEDEPNTLMYVGAFWRASQTGERVIYIPVGAASLNNHGQWSAAISYMDDRWDPANGDGILLSNTPSADPNIRTATFNPNAENFKVTSGSDIISGNVSPGDAIEFRIGLQKKFSDLPACNLDNPNYTSTFPARYAVIMLLYGDDGSGEPKWRRIFIRQGEGADYVMRPEDALGSGARPEAKRFSPYNLKDKNHTYPSGTQSNRTNFDTSTGLGVYVEYPTMVGYAFSAGGRNSSNTNPNTGVVGVSPIIGGAQIQPVNQNNLPFAQSLSNGVGWWVTGATVNGPELCPTGFRRPSDGSVTAAGAGTVTGSEIRQSLWLEPQNGGNTYTSNPAFVGNPSPSNRNNSEGGIYADGYYDRGVIQTTGIYTTTNPTLIGTYQTCVMYSSGYNPAPAASVSGPMLSPQANVLYTHVAASGRLFFNPTTNASVFFPAGGISPLNNGVAIDGVGDVGGYWTRTGYATGASAGAVSYLDFSIWDGGGNSTVQVRMNVGNAQTFMPVRCVKDVN
ncbi:MAG: hypothetical protein FWD60_13990 [Candidatus Azobacteroides sp.]|nr:hypothetical protein [Candidatus Azobacteroides sp.]